MIIKLRNRLIAAIMAFVAVIMLVAFASIYTVTYVRIHNENMEKVASKETVRVTSDGQMILDDQVIKDAVVVNRISPELGVHFNLLVNDAGTIIEIDSALDLTKEDYETAMSIAMKNLNGGIAELGGRKWQYTTGTGMYQSDDDNSLIQASGLTAIRFLDVTDSHQMLATLLITLFGLYITLMVTFFILAWYFASRSVRPMAEAWESQRQFIADASHELKTPISALNANLDVMYASQENTIKEQVKWLDNSKKVLTRMTALIQSMLELAKVDESNNKHSIEKVYINNLLDEVIDYYTPLADNKNIALVEEIEPEIDILSNYSMILQVIEILMDNAIKYTNDSGEIKIVAHTEKRGIVVQIHNTGVGISPVDIDKIFERFYRGDKARVYKEGSYGLGLSIAKATVQKLHGEIVVKSNSERTIFSVRIPSNKRLHHS